MLHAHAHMAWSTHSGQAVLRFRDGAVGEPLSARFFPAFLAASAAGSPPVFAVKQTKAQLHMRNNLAKKEQASRHLCTKLCCELGLSRDINAGSKAVN